MSRPLIGEGLLVYIVVLVGWGDWLFLCACSHNVRCHMSSVVCARHLQQASSWMMCMCLNMPGSTPVVKYVKANNVEFPTVVILVSSRVVSALMAERIKATTSRS